MAARKAPTAIPWSGTVYRATSYDVPFWVRPNRRDGRWNIAYDTCAQYMCLDAEAPFSEMLRHEQLTTEADARTFRTTLWQVRVDEGSVVDYSTFEKADAAGFPPDALVDDDHERCQAEATWLQSHGIRGVLSPSAALPGASNLTLFGPRVLVPWNATVKLASTLCAQPLGIAQPPPGLASRTRHFGQAHVELDAYVATLQPVRVRRKPKP